MPLGRAYFVDGTIFRFEGFAGFAIKASYAQRGYARAIIFDTMPIAASAAQDKFSR